MVSGNYLKRFCSKGNNVVFIISIVIGIIGGLGAILFRWMIYVNQGMFASLFIVAMFDTAFGLITQMLFPTVVTQPYAFALIGMGAVFAHSYRKKRETISCRHC